MTPAELDADMDRKILEHDGYCGTCHRGIDGPDHQPGCSSAAYERLLAAARAEVERLTEYIAAAKECAEANAAEAAKQEKANGRK